MLFNKHIDTILLSILILSSFSSKQIYIFGFFFVIPFIRFIISLYSLSSHPSKINQKNILHLFLLFIISSFLYYIKDASIYGFLMYAVSGLYFFFFLFTYSNTRYLVIENLIKYFNYFVFCQVLLIFIKAFSYNFHKGDWARGTTSNAHIVGIMIGVVIIQFLFDYLYKEKKKSSLFIIIFLTLILWLTDANQFEISLLLSLLFVLFLKSNYSLKSKIITTSSILMIIVILSYFQNNFKSYFENLEKIQKIRGYNTLFDLYEEEPLTIIFGTSIGTYSSRAAVALSSNNYLAKPQGNRLPIQYTSLYIKKYFANLYSQEYYNNLVKAGVTGTFYVPFSTILSIIAEYGIIGIILLIKIIFVIKKEMVYLKKIDLSLYYQIITLSITYLMLFLYDNWLEYPNIVFPYLLILMKGLKKVDIYKLQCKKAIKDK